MSDITCCQDKACKKREKCYRFTAPKSEYQSYFVESPKTTEKGIEKCDEFIDNKGRRR
jgi:hypothetical protein